MLSTPTPGTVIASAPPTANVVLLNVRGAMPFSSWPASALVSVYGADGVAKAASSTPLTSNSFAAVSSAATYEDRIELDPEVDPLEEDPRKDLGGGISEHRTRARRPRS